MTDGGDRATEPVRLLLAGLVRGDDVYELGTALAGLHPRHDTFPGEALMGLAVEALDTAGIDAAHLLTYEGLRERHLPECQFRGRENRKIQFAILATGALRGGIAPDLLDEVRWWGTDDFWWYAMAAAVALVRSVAEAVGQPVAAFAARLAAARGLALD
ncbi:MAG TPA: hypothetical protein VFJ85_13495 [Acidimicrobiales bacterium]|nr:hypothetical protein [Acidimicrobiales bacterium]